MIHVVWGAVISDLAYCSYLLTGLTTFFSFCGSFTAA